MNKQKSVFKILQKKFRSTFFWQCIIIPFQRLLKNDNLDIAESNQSNEKITATRLLSRLFNCYRARKIRLDLERAQQTEIYRERVNLVNSFNDSICYDQETFPKNDGPPEVSIIIPVHNNVKYTYNCLKSLLEKTKGSYEVIIVDDASRDETPHFLKNLTNIKIISHKQYYGFLQSYNEGSMSAVGRYLLFLNSDTLMTDNWLGPLIDCIHEENVGAVGAKLVYPNGELQEAGGIIWNDASVCNYGRGDNPDKPEYNFVREVDYCSGAVLLVQKNLFEYLGGFDTRFQPAFYEDTDLCFSLRNLGYKVLYQPKSVIFHFEGISCGRDITSGVKGHREKNKIIFYEKWKTILEKDHYRFDIENLFLARTRTNGKNILVIDHFVPTYDKDSGSYRMYNMVKILVKIGNKVTFIGDDLMATQPYTRNLQQNGVEVVYSPFIESVQEYLYEYGNFFDIVLVSRPHIAQKNISFIKKYCKNAKIIYDTVDLHFLRAQRRAKIENNEKLLYIVRKLKETELALSRLSDITFVVSPFERDVLLKEDPALHLEVVSNIHEVKGCRMPFHARKNILFLGAFKHLPNTDAVLWFVHDIFPLVKNMNKNIHFYIVGSDPPEEILALAAEDISVTGYVEDIEPYLDNCRIFVAPLRYGAGVKGKINMSMSYGLPVVTTTIGAEGMDLEDGVNTLIADDPEGFAEKINMLYDNERLWEQLSAESIIHVQNNYSFGIVEEKLKEIIRNL